MIDAIFNGLSSALYENAWLALLASFGWGIFSILLSPCHLSSIPLVIGFLSTQGDISTKKSFYLSSIFSVGILITIALIGVVTAMLGRLMGDVGSIGNYLVAGIFVVVGLYLMDIIKINWGGGLKQTSLKGYPAAFVLGLIFGIGLGPCAFAFMAPVLGVVFETAKTNLIYSISLLIAFSIGHCGVIILVGTLVNKVQKYLNWTESSKTVSYLKKICGLLVILAGVYLVYKTF